MNSYKNRSRDWAYMSFIKSQRSRFASREASGTNGLFVCRGTDG